MSVVSPEIKNQGFVKIPATVVHQQGTILYSSKLTKEIRNKLNICKDVYNSDEAIGYQRLIDDKRVDEISEFVYGKKNMLPNAICINFREPIRIEKVSDDFVYLSVPLGMNAWVYEGQHRDAGVWQAWMDGLDGFDLPVVLSNFSKNEELFQFHTMANTAKGVNKSISQAAIVVWQKSQEDKQAARDRLPASMRTHFDTLPDGYFLAHDLNSKNPDGNPWYGKFAVVNSPGKKERGVMDEGKFQNYFRILLKNPDGVFPDEMENKIALMKNYGNAIKQMCPKSFESPKNSHMFKHLGIEFLGKILTKICAFIGVSKGIPTQDQFVEALEKIKTRMNDEFWGGDARKYHGSYNVGLLVKEVSEILESNKPEAISV